MFQESQSSEPPANVSPAIAKYSDYLRLMYLRSKLPIRSKWPRAPCKKTIKLAAVEKNVHNFDPAHLVRANSVDEYMQVNSMSMISLDDILVMKDGRLSKSVIVQGAPGIGKSTFAWKFCRKWAKGKLNNQFYLVVLLQMRDKRVREAKTLADLFYSLDPKLSSSVADEVISRNGKGVLLLFEGLDELPLSVLSEDSFLLEILQATCLPGITTLVTSRPWAVQGLLDKCNNQVSRRVEILGFTKGDISQYVSHAFESDEVNGFRQYLRTHPLLETIMYIPLNAAFVVEIYKEFKRSNQAVPHTLTQLYSSLVKGLIYQCMKDHPDFSQCPVANLKSLPAPIRSVFEQVCELAFSSFTKVSVQVTFTDEEAAMNGCLDSLGLMQSSTDQSIDGGTHINHSFLHYTIQEFLAAYHLSLKPLENQILFFETHAAEPQFFVLLGFLIGLNSDVVQGIRPVVIIESHHLGWLYESQSPKNVAKFLGKGVVYYQSYLKLKPFDIYALTYCMTYSNCSWILIVDVEELTTVFVPPDGDTLDYSGVVEELSIFCATDVGIQKLFSLPHRLFAMLRFLYIYNQINSGKEVAICESLAGTIRRQLFPNLAEFQFVTNNGTSTGVGTVIEALQVSCPHLGTIKLERTLFTNSDMLPLCKYLSSSKTLHKLSLPGNCFLDQTVEDLLTAVSCTKVLTHLDLSKNYLPPPHLDMLSAVLSMESSIKAIQLSSCSIDDEGVISLADGLENNCSVEYLALNSNSIKATGAAALASMLTVNTTLKELLLQGDDSIGISGAMKLINALEANKSLRILYLSETCEPVEYKSILMETVRKEGRVSFVSNCN